MPEILTRRFEDVPDQKVPGSNLSDDDSMDGYYAAIGSAVRCVEVD